jgi:hypothetical protein
MSLGQGERCTSRAVTLTDRVISKLVGDLQSESTRLQTAPNNKVSILRRVIKLRGPAVSPVSRAAIRFQPTPLTPQRGIRRGAVNFCGLSDGPQAHSEVLEARMQHYGGD